MNLISRSLHYIGKNIEDISVIQIGAMDGIKFDNTRCFLDLYKWKSLLIEPIPALFEELKNNFKDRENYTFEQSAITDFDGEVEMLTIPNEIIEKENLHPGYKGMSALYPLKNGFGSDYHRDIEVKSKFGVNIKVPALTFESLLKKHNIEHFDILICDAEGHDWNIFKQIDLAKYKPKFIRLEYNNLTDEEKSMVVAKLKDAGYQIQIGHDIDAVLKEIYNKIENISSNDQEKKPSDFIEVIKRLISKLNAEQIELLKQHLSKPQLDIQNKNLTVVTGLWNINRPGRNFDHYIEHFKRFLEMPVNMFIYIPQEYEYLVWEKRHKENTQVKIYSLDDVKNMYSPFWEKTQNIRTNPDWYNQTGEHGWLPGSPQASIEWYNPIVQSKMFLLNDVTIWNPFNTEYFIWLDAGITNTVYEKYFTENRVLDKILPHLETFLFLSYPYEAQDEIHGFDFKAINRYAGRKVEYVCRGGLFGGKKEFINNANALYYSLLDKTLGSGYMGTEESVFTIMSYIEPEIYRRYALDGNGLIVKFIQALLEDRVELEPIPDYRIFLKPKNLDTSNLKTSLYMLTFNFPEQVRHTLETYKKNQPEFLEKTRKILIDNSNKEEAVQGNKQLCEEYGIEHIITGDNLGINRGRQYVADHFQKSDSDYYVFLEDDMGVYGPEDTYCRNGFRHYIPNLYQVIHKIMLKEEFDFLKLSYTEVYMDNNIQVSWYNVPQHIRTETWPHYDKLPIQGLDPNAPRTKFNKIDVLDGVSYIDGEIYYANWPMIVGKTGNQKMFLDTNWANPFEQTWMSHMFQETVKGNIKPGILLASPIHHNRIAHYSASERREN